MKLSANGYTLVEMLLSLMIFLLIVLTIPLLLKIGAAWTTGNHAFNEFEFQVFIEQTKIELKESIQLTVRDDMISFKKNTGQIVTFERYGDKIRRRVNGFGHEILLQNVNRIHYYPENNGLTINYYDLEQQEHTERISAIAAIQVISDE